MGAGVLKEADAAESGSDGACFGAAALDLTPSEKSELAGQALQQR